MNLATAMQLVVTHPHAVEHRLAYAELVGGDRAAFIRAQVQASEALRASPARIDADAILLAEELLEGNAHAWANGLDTVATSYTFMRGFVELMTVDANWFVTNWQDVFARGPVRHLVVHGLANAPTFFACPGLAQIVGLTVNLYGTPFHLEAFTDEQAAQLVASPYCAHLRYFDASHTQLTDAGKAAVCRGLPGLQAALFDGLEESIASDYDGTITSIMPSTGLAAFEATYGSFVCLHEIERTQTAVTRERY